MTARDGWRVYPVKKNGNSCYPVSKRDARLYHIDIIIYFSRPINIWNGDAQFIRIPPVNFLEGRKNFASQVKEYGIN
jgi:hypothetical protein